MTTRFPDEACAVTCTCSLFTWHISLWPNCGFWSIVAFYFLCDA